MNNLYPQYIIRLANIISQIFEGNRNAHKVTTPIMTRSKPTSSTSPRLQQHFFLFQNSLNLLSLPISRIFICSSDTYFINNNSSNTTTSTINIMYQNVSGTDCINITDPPNAKIMPPIFLILSFFLRILLIVHTAPKNKATLIQCMRAAN